MEEGMEKELLEDTKIEELQEEMQAIANLIGLENLLKLSHYVNGSQIYIPIPEAILRKARNRKIKAEYNGCNTKELSQKWHITEDRVKKILCDYNPKQMNIFDVFDESGKLR